MCEGGGDSVSSQEYVSTACASLMMHQTRPHTISCIRWLCREFARILMPPWTADKLRLKIAFTHWRVADPERCFLPPSRRPVVQHRLQAPGPRQAFPEDTITLGDSLLARDQLCLTVTVESSLRRAHHHETPFVALFVHQYGILEPRQHALHKPLMRTAFNRAVYELRDIRGEPYDLDNELQQSQRGAALGPAAHADGVSALRRDHSLRCGVRTALGGGIPGGGTGSGSSCSALCLTNVYRRAAVRAATGLTLTISVKDTASSVSALLPFGPQEQPGQPAMFSLSPRCPSRSHTAKMLQSKDGCMCMGVYRYTEDVKDILYRMYAASRLNIYRALLLGCREVEIGADEAARRMALDMVQYLGLHNSMDSLLSSTVLLAWRGI
ncbi:hypothetical protein VTO73DRAFT_10365 [Trametes versicolor]